MCDWEGCTTGTIGLPNPNQRRVVKTSGFLHPYIYRYTARVPRDRFLAFEGEGMTWMRQPSRQGIALFSVRMEFWRSSVSRKKQICSVGGRPTGAKVRSPLAWVVSAEDNEADEADRQSHRKDGE